MAEYRYRGPGPEEREGEIVRPGDRREFSEEPGWGAWELVPGDERQSAAGAAPVKAGASDGQSSLTLPAEQEGM